MHNIRTNSSKFLGGVKNPEDSSVVLVTCHTRTWIQVFSLDFLTVYVKSKLEISTTVEFRLKLERVYQSSFCGCFTGRKLISFFKSLLLEKIDYNAEVILGAAIIQ